VISRAQVMKLSGKLPIRGAHRVVAAPFPVMHDGQRPENPQGTDRHPGSIVTRNSRAPDSGTATNFVTVRI
jgi:hypothetical protein